jgi:hypothetical protein
LFDAAQPVEPREAPDKLTPFMPTPLRSPRKAARSKETSEAAP